MEKKTEKLDKQIIDARTERGISKAIYDSQVIVLEAQRRQVIDLEAYNQRLSDEYVEACNKVQRLMLQRSDLIEETESKNKELETKTENDEN